MVELLNTSGVIYSTLYHLTINVMGNWFLSLLFLLLALVILAILFRIPFEFIVLIAIIPTLLVLAAFEANFRVMLGFLLFYLAIIWFKNYLFR